MTRAIAILLLGAALLAAPPGCRNLGAGGDRVGMPAGFPPDIPIPAAAVLRTAQDLGRRGLNLVWESGEGAGTLADAMRARMAGAGWGLVAEAALEDGTFLSYRKGERSVAIGVTREGGGSLVAVAYFASPWVEGAEEGEG